MSETDKKRLRRAKLNVVVSLLSQFVTLVCGIVVPGLMIKSFGSELYGATASITQFLAYISLLEAGIGGVARAALYKPLAESDDYKISAIVSEIKHFFKNIGFIFFAYVIILSLTYYYIAKVKCLDWLSTCVLVLVISISTFAQYFIGISYAILIQSAQKTYITQMISMGALVLNTIAIVFLIQCGSNIILVKFISSVVFALKPLAMWLYVKKAFNLVRVDEHNPKLLKQKWNALGQHIAFFLHSNTDIAVLTIFDRLTTVSVYAVHNMIVMQIQNVTSSFSTGMESIFGDMLAKKEYDSLKKTFLVYETMISSIGVILFGVTSIMIIPFIRIYVENVNDVNYIYPVFAFLLVFSSLLYCLRIPYHSIIIAAGHFKETQFAAYGEALINIVISILFVIKYGITGVTVGTVCAVAFRFAYYVYYVPKYLLHDKLRNYINRLLIHVFTFGALAVLGNVLIDKFIIRNYLEWVICAAGVFVIVLFVEILVMLVFYREQIKPIFLRIMHKRGY